MIYGTIHDWFTVRYTGMGMVRHTDMVRGTEHGVVSIQVQTRYSSIFSLVASDFSFFFFLFAVCINCTKYDLLLSLALLLSFSFLHVVFVFDSLFATCVYYTWYV